MMKSREKLRRKACCIYVFKILYMILYFLIAMSAKAIFAIIALAAIVGFGTAASAIQAFAADDGDKELDSNQEECLREFPKFKDECEEVFPVEIQIT